MIGIYAIKNEVSGKMYVGSTGSSFEHRRYTHINLLRKGAHDNKHLQAEWNKYGADSFVFSVLEVVGSRDELLEREQAWLDKYWDGGKKCYNIAKYAEAFARKDVGLEIGLTDRAARVVSRFLRGLGYSKADRKGCAGYSPFEIAQALEPYDGDLQKQLADDIAATAGYKPKREKRRKEDK